MQEIKIEATDKTPKVSFDHKTGKMELSGRSRPESSLQFYGPIDEWLEEYAKNPASQTTIDFKLDYFDTSSSKWFLTILKHFEIIYSKGFDVLVNWYYDDDDIMEYGEEVKEIREVPLNLIEF